MKRIVCTFLLVSTLVMILITAITCYGQGAHVDEHRFQTIIPYPEYLQALLAHDIDAGRVPLPEDLVTLEDAGFTITSETRLGYTSIMENNRVWPFGTANGKPEDLEYWRTMNFRKACHRLIPKSECVALHAPLKSEAEWWLPPGQAYWINPDTPLPTYDPMTTIAYLDAAGFVAGATPNPYYDSGLAWSSPTLRIDPVKGGNVEFEYYALHPFESPTDWDMAQLITSYFRKAGLTVDLVAGTWLGMVSRLVNYNLYDYQMMTGIGMAWDTVAPDVLYDFTYSENVPLWNFVHMNIAEADEAGTRMMSTLDLAACRQAAYDIQTFLAYYEPYFPLLLDNGFSAFTGPYGEEPGAIGIVNAKGYGALGFNDLNVGLLRPPSAQGCNPWGKMLSRANRYDPAGPTVEINNWGLGGYMDTLNPLTADTAFDWQILSLVEDYLFKRHPYTMDYMWWAAENAPTIEAWIGPGRSQIGGNGVYDASFDGTHYNGIPVEDVTSADMVDDDQLGMVTTWTLRPGMYWHDSDPGPDMRWDTADDGVKHPVTAEDARFCLDLLKVQENVRYSSQWSFIHCVEVIDSYTFRVFEERRYPFAFEGHNDVALLAPKHIWEPWINPTIDVDACECIHPDGSIGYGNVWTDYTNHHEQWFGWEEPYMEDPIYPGQMLTYLIGFGPFIYHLGGWEPGVSAHVEDNLCYFGGPICPADVNFDRIVDELDLEEVGAAQGAYEDPNFNVRDDVCYPAQVISLDEYYFVQGHLGQTWGPSPAPPTTPEDQTQALTETIETWNLPQGTESSLTSKLEAVLGLLDKGNEKGAVKKLTDFMQQVEAFREKKLTNEQADYLIAEAQGIINLIEEG